MNGLAPSQLTIDLDAYAHNLHAVREFVDDSCTTLAVVKADAYGCGAVPVVTRAIQENIKMVGVATVEEGIVLRNAFPDLRILILMQPQKEALAAAVEHDLRVMVSDVSVAEHLGNVARKAKKLVIVHCKVDTGMGRQGFALETAPEYILDITRISNVDIEGIATHFPVADYTDNPFTENQIRSFKTLLKRLERDGIPYEIAHAANSAGIVNAPQSHFDMVRPGLMTYGVWPTPNPTEPFPLQPVVSWKSRIVHMKELAGGASVGYGRVYRAPNPRRLGVVPVGYADGYLHSLSNRGEVLIRGTRCPVRGRVSMDSIVVDVTHVSAAKLGDTVILIGQDGDETISVESHAKLANTIPYEVLTSIGPRVARKYIP